MSNKTAIDQLITAINEQTENGARGYGMTIGNTTNFEADKWKAASIFCSPQFDYETGHFRTPNEQFFCEQFIKSSGIEYRPFKPEENDPFLLYGGIALAVAGGVFLISLVGAK